MSVDYDGHYSAIGHFVQENWLETVEFVGEAASRPAEGSTDEWISFDLVDHAGYRIGGEYGEVKNSQGNIEVRIYGPREKGAKAVRMRARDFDSMIESASLDSDVGMQFGESAISSVGNHQGFGVLMCVYTRPFWTVAA